MGVARFPPQSPLKLAALIAIAAGILGAAYFLPSYLSPLSSNHPSREPSPPPGDSANSIGGGATPPPVPEFPWPPPKTSAFEVIPRKLLVHTEQHVTLGVINAELDEAFRQCGYVQRSYYAVPDGFAVASRIEQINEDGSTGLNRWVLDVPEMPQFSLAAYVKALLKAPHPGRFRVIVFILTRHPFGQTDVKITGAEAGAWISSGLNTLPNPIGKLEYSQDYNCTAMIYEFRGSKAKTAEFVDPSEISADTHLIKAGLLAALSSQP